MSERKKKSGISLLEIIVSMIILALVMVGLMNVFVVGRGYMAHSRFRTSAGQLATVFLDPLQNEVREDTWDSNNLSVTTTPQTRATQEIDGITYTPTYFITDESSGAALRRVRVNVTWNETR